MSKVIAAGIYYGAGIVLLAVAVLLVPITWILEAKWQR